MEWSMPCKTFNIGIPRNNPIETIDRFYDAAFGPVPEFFMFTSWCGWRPICEAKQLRNLMADLLTRRSPAEKQSPRIDVYETKEALIIEVALADIRKESLYLEMVANGLIIRGERRPGASEVAQGDIASLRFQRFVRLPYATRTASIKAETKGDVVKIDIRKHNG
jgi:HSP20 family molecular chaperone IbpA